MKRSVVGFSDGDVAIAYIWFIFFVIMAVGGLFVNPNGPVVALVLLAAVFGGWGLLDWRRKKKADHAMKSRNSIACKEVVGLLGR